MEDISAIDDIILAKIRDGITKDIKDFLEPEEVINRTTAVQLAGDIAKGGAIVAYREQCRQEAVDAFLRLDEVVLTDIAAVAQLQRAASRYLHVERFFQEHLGEFDRMRRPQPSGDDEVDDEI